MYASGSGLWPVRCAPVGLVAVGSVLWRYDRALYCTPIVKATFTLPESGQVARLNPTPICRADDYFHGLPSLAAGCETAPRLSRAQVTAVGHAYADESDRTKRSVRLMLVRGEQILIDKTLYVYGDRDPQGEVLPFDRIHVGYERALGGLDHPDNPIGVGLDGNSSRFPNIIDPRAPERRVAGYGPIPSRFPERRRQRGKVPQEIIEQGIADYPSGFDWEYFQAAPLDQRLPKLHGDEWLLLEGMHPQHERIRARLPRARARCRIYSRKQVGAPDSVELTADMLHVEPDHGRCSLVWRGRFPIASELAADHLIIAGAVEEDGVTTVWPAGIEELELAASPAPRSSDVAGRVADDLQATAFVPSTAQAVQRSLGLGYRLGERKIELDGAPPKGDAAPPTGSEQPPDIPPSEMPPAPPSFTGLGTWMVPASPAVPADLSGGEDPLCATDEMPDPDREAAQDAGLELSDSAEMVALDDGDIEFVDTND